MSSKAVWNRPIAEAFSTGRHSRNVDLRYPSRPDALAIRDLSLTFQPGVHYAFCGASGSGKSRSVRGCTVIDKV